LVAICFVVAINTGMCLIDATCPTIIYSHPLLLLSPSSVLVAAATSSVSAIILSTPCVQRASWCGGRVLH
jgi:hypothetical protein